MYLRICGHQFKVKFLMSNRNHTNVEDCFVVSILKAGAIVGHVHCKSIENMVLD